MVMMVTYSYNFHKDRISIEFFMLLLHVFKDSDCNPGETFFSLWIDSEIRNPYVLVYQKKEKTTGRDSLIQNSTSQNCTAKIRYCTHPQYVILIIQ